MITTLLAFITSKGHRLLESFSTSEVLASTLTCGGDTCQGAAGPRLCPGLGGRGVVHGEGVVQSSRGSGRQAEPATHTAASRTPVHTGLCQVSTRKNFWKCCASHVCDSRQQDCSTSVTPPRTKTIYATKWPVTCPERKWNSPVQSTRHEVFLN